MFELLSMLSGWLQRLSPFETAMMVMIFWISATLAAVTIHSPFRRIAARSRPR